MARDHYVDVIHLLHIIYRSKAMSEGSPTHIIAAQTDKNWTRAGT